MIRTLLGMTHCLEEFVVFSKLSLSEAHELFGEKTDGTKRKPSSKESSLFPI